MNFSRALMLPALLLVAAALSAQADDLRAAYTARLSAADHTSSAGVRLDSAAAVIRQDRANYHKFKLRDDEDEGDTFFSNAKNREVMEKMLERGSSDKGVLRQIVNGTPLIRVEVYAGGKGIDYVRVRVLAE